MADIVISHATEDRDRAEILGRALSAQGLKVWMYRDILGGGGDRDEVNAKIRAAARVLALWSPAGCASPWVLEEARAAAQDHRLINVELLSGLTPRAFQAGLRIDLSGWQGQRNDPSLEPVAQAIATIVGKDEAAEPRRANVSGLSGKLFGREAAPAQAQAVKSSAPAPVAELPGTAQAASKATPKAASGAPLKIEVFETDKPRSEPEKTARRWYEMSPGRMFAIGLVFSVAIGGAVVALRHEFNTHPIAVAARAAAEQEAAAAATEGFSGEPASVKFVKELGQSDKPLTAVAYGSNEWLQAIGDSGGGLRLIAASDGELYSTLKAGTKPVTRVAFDGGAEYVAAASMDGNVYVFRASDGGLTKFAIGAAPVRALAWHPSDVLIASGTDAGVLDIRSLIGDVKPVQYKFDSPITAIAWRRDGAVLALGFKSGAVRFVDSRTGKELYAAAAHLGQVNALAFAPSSATLASAGEDGLVKTWNADTGEALLSIPSRPCTPTELDKDDHCPALDLVYSSPDGEILLTSNQKGEVEGFNPKTGERVMRIRGHHAPVTGVAWSRYNHRITTIDSAGKAAFWTSPFDKPWTPGEEAK